MSAIASASAGMIGALLRFERASTQAVARASGAAAGDLVDPMVEIVQAKAQFRASAAVFRAADDMVRAVLDIRV